MFIVDPRRCQFTIEDEWKAVSDVADGVRQESNPSRKINLPQKLDGALVGWRQRLCLVPEPLQQLTPSCCPDACSVIIRIRCWRRFCRRRRHDNDYCSRPRRRRSGHALPGSDRVSARGSQPKASALRRFSFQFSVFPLSAFPFTRARAGRRRRARRRGRGRRGRGPAWAGGPPLPFPEAPPPWACRAPGRS